MREPEVGELSESEVMFLEHLHQSQAQGVSLAGYCRSRDLNVGLLYRIKQGLAHRGMKECGEAAVRKVRALPARFTPVRISPSPAMPITTACRIKHPTGWVVECASFPPPAWLNALMMGESS